MKKLKKKLHKSAVPKAVLTAFVIAILGFIFLRFSRAATFSAVVDPETGVVAPPAQSKQDATAANGSSVVFGSAASAMNVYFGSTHTHTSCCNDHGEAADVPPSTAKDIFTKAKTNGGYQFLFLTEHSGGTGPSSQGLDPTVFFNDVKAQAQAITDSTFVGFAGIEYSDNDTDKGHMTGVNQDGFISADGSNNSSYLMDYMVAQKAAGKPAFAGFNHPGAGGHPGSDPSRFTAARRDIMVLSEIHNSALSDSADAGNLAGLVVELDRGWRVAPTCGVDGHGYWRVSTSFKEPNPCRTGVLAPSLTRNNLNDAFINRRIYSSRDLNMNVKYKANGQWMGSIIGKPTTTNFEIQVSDPDTTNANDKIKKIEIITEGGAIAASQTFDAHSVTWNPSIATPKKYYFLKIYNGERATYTAAAAPVWLE